MTAVAITMAIVSLGFFIWVVVKLAKESKSTGDDNKDDEDYVGSAPPRRNDPK